MRAVVLLSGGLDSYTAAAIAKSEGFALNALTIHYGQRHAREIESARAVARALGVERHLELSIDLRAIGGSSLTSDRRRAARPRPQRDRHSLDLRAGAEHDLPVARARLGRSRSMPRDIVIGVNALDYSGYPDCRPEFIAAFERLALGRDASGCRGRTISRSYAADRADQGGDHPARHSSWVSTTG